MRSTGNTNCPLELKERNTYRDEAQVTLMWEFPDAKQIKKEMANPEVNVSLPEKTKIISNQCQQCSKSFSNLGRLGGLSGIACLAAFSESTVAVGKKFKMASLIISRQK